MKQIRHMSAGELAKEFMGLTELPRPSSGKLRNLDSALIPFQGRGDLLDAQLLCFHAGVDAFVSALKRGHTGQSQWAAVTAAASKIAPVLDVLDTMQQKGK